LYIVPMTQEIPCSGKIGLALQKEWKTAGRSRKDFFESVKIPHPHHLLIHKEYSIIQRKSLLGKRAGVLRETSVRRAEKPSLVHGNYTMKTYSNLVDHKGIGET